MTGSRVPPAAEQLPQPGYAADAPRPPVGFSIDVPDHWTVVDLDPATQQGWLDAFLDSRLTGRPGARDERPPARRALLEVMERLHDAQVFLAAILAGEAGGELLSASVTLGWRRPDYGGGRPPLEALRAVYADAPAATDQDAAARRVDIVELSVGGAVRVSSRQRIELPDGARVDGVATTQYVVPVMETGWLAVLTGSTGTEVLAEGVAEVVDSMAASLRLHTARP